MSIIRFHQSYRLIVIRLRQNGITYSIHEKETPSHRPRDWGMSYFWSANYLPKLLPESILSRLQEAQVNPHRPDPLTQTMIVTNGATGETIKEVPSPGGRRVGRRAFRKLLGEGMDVRVGGLLMRACRSTGTLQLLHRTWLRSDVTLSSMINISRTSSIQLRG